MAEDAVSAIIASTCDPTDGLRSTILAIPDLPASSLDQQLQNTLFVCRTVQSHCKLLHLGESENSRRVIDIIEFLGQYAEDGKNALDSAYRENTVQWETFKLRGRDIAGIALSFQMYTSSVFIGAVGEARTRDLIILSPQAQAEFDDVVGETTAVLKTNQKLLNEKISQFLRKNLLEKGLTIAN